MMFDSHGNLGVDGLLPTDRPHVVKVYGSYLFKIGTNVGLNFYGGSGTPVSKSVQSIYRYPILVEGRGSLGRTRCPDADRPARLARVPDARPQASAPRVQRAEHLQSEAGAARLRHGQPHRRERPRVCRAPALQLVAARTCRTGTTTTRFWPRRRTRPSRQERRAPATRIRAIRWATSSTPDSTAASPFVSCSKQREAGFDRPSQKEKGRLRAGLFFGPRSTVMSTVSPPTTNHYPPTS